MKKISLFFVLVIMLFAAPQTNALIIDIAPGSSPAGAYLSLSLFGVSPIAGVGDDTIVNMNVPSFSYAGQSWNRVGIVSNGYLVIGGGTDADVNALNDSFPNTAAPNNILAPFWTNLNPEAGGAIRIATLTDGTNNWIVVDWAEVPNFNTAAGLQYNSFEAWLRTGSVEDITFTYGVVTGGKIVRYALAVVAGAFVIAFYIPWWLAILNIIPAEVAWIGVFGNIWLNGLITPWTLGFILMKLLYTFTRRWNMYWADHERVEF